MFTGKLDKNNSRNIQKCNHPIIPASENIQSDREKINPNRGFIKMITNKIKKLRWPRVPQQFYIGPGVDWE